MLEGEHGIASCVNLVVVFVYAVDVAALDVTASQGPRKLDRRLGVTEWDVGESDRLSTRPEEGEVWLDMGLVAEGCRCERNDLYLDA